MAKLKAAKAKAKAPARRRKKETANTETYHPNLASEEKGIRPPNLEPSPPFLLKFHPDRWVISKGSILPCFGKLKLQRGINRVDYRGGRFIVGEAKADAVRRGWTVIPIDIQGPGTSYLRCPEGTNAHILQWVKTYPGSSRMDRDDAGYIAFCEGLINDGHIEPPPLHILERMRSVWSDRHITAADRAVVVPSARVEANAAEATVKLLDAEIKKRTAALIPTDNAPTIPDMVE